MTKIIAINLFAWICFAAPLHAQMWDEAPSETTDLKDAGASSENGPSDDIDENKEEKAAPDPIIIKSDKVFSRVKRLDLSGAFGYNPLVNSFANNALGLTFWAVFPSLEKGFLDGINDSFDLEAGIYSEWVWAGYTVIRHNFSFMPAVGGRWNFHITPRWDVYAAARVGLRLDNTLRIAGAGALGALWKYNEDFSLRAEMDSQHLLNLGVSFPY